MIINEKEIGACSIFGALNQNGERFGGESVIRAMARMHDRSNGLGGGFAVYGLYPMYKDYYAFHLMYENGSLEAKKEAEAFLHEHFDVVHDEEIPNTGDSKSPNAPLTWRYFVTPTERDVIVSEEGYVAQKVVRLNDTIEDAYVFSSGKDMGVFKGVGYPEDVAEYFLLDELYSGYMWTAHGRFPTNTPGSWTGAHPFNLLDQTVVHNGEISSYGTNRRYLEMYGYRCTVHTDTEVLVYATDLLLRRQGLPVEVVSNILAPPTWESIDNREVEERRRLTVQRQVYAPLLMNGPFAVIIARHGEMVGLTDRIRLRPLTAAEGGDMLYLSSEESAIRFVSPKLDKVWAPNGGEPVVGKVRKEIGVKDEVLPLARVSA
jgi:glutamate synthase (NADPH) GltB1 subunit (EC 1.4.1.13)